MYRSLLLAFICFGSLQAMPHALDLETAWRRTKDLGPASEAWRAWKAKADCQKASPLLEKKADIELKRAQALSVC